MLQKAKKWFLIVLCLFIGVIGVVERPVFALASYQPANYISGVSVNGDIKTVTYLFDNGIPLTNIWEIPSGNKQQISSKTVTYFPTDGTTSFSARAYYLGAEAYDDGPMPDYCVIDVGDIMDQAPVSISSRFSLQVYNIASTGIPDVIKPVISLRYSYGFFAYDKSGQYIGTYYGTARTVEIDPSGVSDFVARYDAPLPAGIKYMLPFNSYSGTMSNGSFDDLGLSINNWYFQMEVDINMIYEQSQTMNEIKDTVGDIDDKLDGVNDKLDDTNDKLDDANDKLGDTNDKLDDILEQPEQEKNEANEAGKEAIEDILDVIPDDSPGFMDAVGDFTKTMSYNGTTAKLAIPAVQFPSLPGLVDSFTILPQTQFDFSTYVDMMPDSVLLVVRSLLTAALIVFCFKELYGTIQYVLTMRGGD